MDLAITTLKAFDISNNEISSETAGDIAYVRSRQVKLENLILSKNNLQDGLIAITKELKCYSALKVLTFQTIMQIPLQLIKLQSFFVFKLN